VTDDQVTLGTAAAPAVARVALGLLDAAHAAEQRVRDEADGEALHDFRVALRRLRSTLRSFRTELDRATPRKLRTGVRDLARATAPARDAEVLAAWTKELEPEVPRAKRAGMPWFEARLAERRDRAYAEIQADVIPGFAKLERRLRKALALVARRERDGASYGTVLGSLVSEHAAVLEQELATFQSPSDDAAAHSARISAKRLRYILEPVVELEPRAGTIVAALKRLQTLLGEVHDLGLLATELADAVATAAAERARRQHDRALGAAAPAGGARRSRPQAATPGLLALARAVHAAREERFRRFTADWRGAALTDLMNECAALATTFSTSAIPFPAAHEDRKADARRAGPAVT
jgi:CHAD domain-containing protein